MIYHQIYLFADRKSCRVNWVFCSSWHILQACVAHNGRLCYCETAPCVCGHFERKWQGHTEGELNGCRQLLEMCWDLLEQRGTTWNIVVYVVPLLFKVVDIPWRSAMDAVCTPPPIPLQMPGGWWSQSYIWLSSLAQGQTGLFDQLSLIVVLKLCYIYCNCKTTLASLWPVLLFALNSSSVVTFLNLMHH